MAYDRLIPLMDVGEPITVKAEGIISGGDLVRWTSGTDCVGSGAETFAWNDITVAVASGTAGEYVENVCGIALQTVTSGGEVAIAQDGTFILPAGSNGISGGMSVVFVGYKNCVEKISTGSVALAEIPIGRAMTAASAEGKFAIIKLNI